MMPIQEVIMREQAPYAEYCNDELEEYIKILHKKYKLNRKILLIQVPQFQFESFSCEIARNRSYYAFPPTGLQCIAKSLENRNFELKILDLNYELLRMVKLGQKFDYRNWLSILDDTLDNFKPSIIGTTCINVSKLWSDTNPFSAMLRHLKRIDEHIVIAGGASIMNDFETCLEEELCHFVVDGEGEDKINFLLDKLYYENLNYLPTPKIYFKLNENIAQTKGINKNQCLQGNLINTYKLTPIELYCKVGVLNHYSRMSGEDKPFAAIHLGRGCRMNCKFCGVPKFMGRGVRHFLASDLLEEIAYLVEKKSIRHFEWLDDDLLAHPDVLKEVLLGIIELKKIYNITWAANNGLIAAFLNEEILSLMRDSGCVGFKIGIETGNPDMLRKIRKPATVEKILYACELINKFPEIFVGGSYIIGFFAEEPFWQMLDTFKLSCKTNLDWSSISVFQFTSKETIIQENLKQKDLGDTAVTPARYRPDGKVLSEKEVISGPDIFTIPKNIIPSPDQIRQIWFTFNLIGNYINNKNLKPDGKPAKFTSWIEVLEITYPHNAYMPLFASLGYIMLGNKAKAEQQLEKARERLRDDKYWQERFEQFELTSIIENFPKTAEQVQDILNPLRDRYYNWTD